ncbi:hypothetical protein ADM99_00135 [Leptolinea tardivitalis]|uniref:Uncharacterized protein n=2 Tax=Leptolinea tardivitalis TaxID=229920 RepID=A0A0P6Y0Q7_9CHLR|nr:hypothetical protein ADM99_00135 [Leptolinea tardivitalis]GAP20460.1 hypothetical protein LTAR_00650 [Leptolinea tardivitalis]
MHKITCSGRIKSVFYSVMIGYFLLVEGCSPILAQQERESRKPKTPTVTSTQPPISFTMTPMMDLTPVSGVTLSDFKPGDPHGTPQIIYDQTCVSTSAEHKAPGGDDYTQGRFERPFDKEMNYLPSLDIVRAELVRSGYGWDYFTIVLEAEPASSPVVYGLELDLNIDGRGDFLIQLPAPTSSTWTETGVKMFWDSDGDVGGRVINRSDPHGYKGSGFESIKIDANAGKTRGQIWSRLISNGLQIAVAENLTGGKNSKFSWKPYTDGNPFPPTWYDIDDYFTMEQAGSAIVGDLDYPLKAVYTVDNTCRGLSGLTPSGNEQGVCPP